MLAALNVRVGPAMVKGTPTAKAPICITTYLIAKDGALTEANRYEIASADGQNAFWCAFV